MMNDSTEGTQTAGEPFKAFRFRVKWDGQYIAGVSRVGGLKRHTEVTLHQEGGLGGATRKSPGKTEYEAISLERALTSDRAFEIWANEVAAQQAGFRKDIAIELYDAQGRLALRYHVHRCWVSEYHALPELDAAGNAVAMESITLENEGWEIDKEARPAAERPQA
jgi:phage tail-like protein